MAPAAPGLVIAAPASGSGKTTLTLGLLRSLARRGLAVSSVKVGPDYVDPTFHRAASGRTSWNVDLWGMRPATVDAVLARASGGVAQVVAEGVMGLYDAAEGGKGSTADLAVRAGWPVVLVVDGFALAESAAAIVHGFATLRAEPGVAAIVLNRVVGSGHERRIREACEPLGIPILGVIPHRTDLGMPERHLGLVPAGEREDLEVFLEKAADLVEASVDVGALLALGRPTRVAGTPPPDALPAPGERIAVARDAAFLFAYPWTLERWEASGASLRFFSPLADEPPDPRADAVVLPGGYPELHAERLARASTFQDGLRARAAAGAAVLGECGGFMVLGRTLVDGQGRRHPMAGLLDVETSFEHPRLQIGYRRLETIEPGPLGPAGVRFRAHEFHFASLLGRPATSPAFRVSDPDGGPLGTFGARSGSVLGSFLHLIDLEGEASPGLMTFRVAPKGISRTKFGKSRAHER